MGFNIVENDSLRVEITNLYTILYDNIDGQVAVHKYFVQNHLFPQIMENIKTDTFLKRAYPVDHESLSKNHKFKELINYNCALINVMINQYSMIDEKILSLIKLIDEEVNSRS